MKVLVITDIHSNLAALRAVLEAAAPFDKVWCTGDIVGYGPEPNECVEMLAGLPLRATAGNHDLGALGKLPLQVFNPAARAALRWTADALTRESIQFLESLPRTLVTDDTLLCHGSPREPVWEYLFSPFQAENSFPVFAQQLCLVGHTHLPAVFRKAGGAACEQVPWDPPVLTIEEGLRFILNPGSTGQPRDGDHRASFAVYLPDRHTVENIRINYDFSLTQRKMSQAGLPQSLIDRLPWGL